MCVSTIRETEVDVVVDGLEEDEGGGEVSYGGEDSGHEQVIVNTHRTVSAEPGILEKSDCLILHSRHAKGGI